VSRSYGKEYDWTFGLVSLLLSDLCKVCIKDVVECPTPVTVYVMMERKRR